MWSMVAQRLTLITPPASTPDQLWQRVVAAWSAVPQELIQSLFESMTRRVAAVSAAKSVFIFEFSLRIVLKISSASHCVGFELCQLILFHQHYCVHLNNLKKVRSSPDSGKVFSSLV
ncbi:hypothetical protein TNCV_1872241 [Trichonephila clavipes]|nr:hypothetical protein TNCV_1872241 [Trichonephila clavipes]